MTNRRYDPVSYRPFRTEPLLSEGLLPVHREGGEMLERVSSAMFRLAAQAGVVADRQAATRGAREGQAAALAGRPHVALGEAQPGGGRAKPAVLRADVNAAIEAAAARHGVDPNTLKIIANIESSGNPNAKNPRSSAGGLFQFIDGTARQYGLKNRFDAAEAADAGARLARDNARYLRGVLGRDPTPGELYLAHQQGAGGAAKLLKNPDASAASVVGAEAVRLNGGSPGMTAGQFARKWIDRAEEGYSLPIEAGPPTIEGGTFRPTGSDTIYGRAYDEAGAKVYLDQVRTEILSTTQQLSEQYKDDPAGLEKALGELKGALKQDHIFPEIEADFESDYGRLSVGLLSRARQAQADKLEARQLGEWSGRGDVLKTDLARQAAGIDPSDPNAGQVLAGALASIADHYDAGVELGAISPAEAARQKRLTGNATALDFYQRQAELYDADGVAALRQTMRADFAGGGLDGLDGDGWTDLEAKLISLEKNKRDAAHSGAATARATGKALADRAAMGFPPDEATMAAFDAEAAKVEGGAEIADAVRRKMAAATAISTLPLPQSRAYVEKMRAGLGDNPSDEEIATLKYAEDHLEKTEKAIGKDPLGHAAATRAIDLVEIDTSTPEAMTATLQARKEQVREVAGRYGVPVMLYTPAEVTAMKADISSGDPARYAAVMGQLDFLSADGGLTEISREFGDKAADQLQDWQARLRYATPEETRLWLKDRADPKWQDRVKPLVAEGARKARELPFDRLVSDLDPNRIFDIAGPIDPDTRRMMQNDYVQLAAERYAATGDEATARKQAVERMQKTWGATGVYGTRGGRLMPYPPEKSYPAVGGSMDWLGEEVAEMAKSRGVPLENLSLVADGKTKFEADNRKAPGYLVSVVDPDTGLDELVTDDRGRPIRHYFDPAAAQQKALVAAEQRRAKTYADTSGVGAVVGHGFRDSPLMGTPEGLQKLQTGNNPPWVEIDSNSAIGPFYPPWRPTHSADDYAARRARHLAVRRVLAGREKE